MAQENHSFPGKIVVIGGSPWCVRAARELLNALPAASDMAVCLVIHDADSALIERLGSLSWPCTFVRNGQVLEKDHIYLAPPNEHMLVSEEKVYVATLAKIHGRRPAIDPLFQSAADAYGERVCGILLSPEQEDGIGGLEIIRRKGGKSAVLLPFEGPFYPGVPVPRKDWDADYFSSAPEDIAHWLMNAKFSTVKQPPKAPLADSALPPPIICPDCGGPLSGQMAEGGPKFHCHVGHVFAPAALHKHWRGR